MIQSTFYLISNDPELIQKARQFWETYGVTVQVYSPTQWNEWIENHDYRERLKVGVPALAGGLSATRTGNVVPFPTNPQDYHNDRRVSTMNDIEKIAIQNAIGEYKGNLTEAAKALGIGRATLYRKVKQYKIDPTSARKKRAA